ncbi:MAG: integrase arm-type DNA-binding domain-containing protein [Deltaproteobacteria bacterium]|nr:integrase arm-type DNA-binding domain-containing protein [Deltaproteobacteria bacterium]
MYLYDSPTGLKSWRYEYACQGKRTTVTFGKYPFVSLKEAREKLNESKKLIIEGIDPVQQKKDLKELNKKANKDTFEAVVLEWFERNKTGKNEKYTYHLKLRLNKNLFPFLGKNPFLK